MKITETITRECCENKDLVDYKGLASVYMERLKPKFCKLCGQVWFLEKSPGDMDSGYVKFIIARGDE